MKTGQEGGSPDLNPDYKDIERSALASSRVQERPHAVLLGGQPGSGKSKLSGAVVESFRDRGGSVVIDADELRAANPRYLMLSRTDPQHAADLTHKEASAWAKQLTQAAVEGRRNLVIDGTMRNPEAMQGLAARLKAEGYTVEARVIAINSEQSMSRARLRFENSIAERGTGRFVNQQQHDEAYAGLAKTVRVLEQGGFFSSVRVYDGSQREIYANEQVNGRWQREPAADKVLAQERARPWTHAEHRGYVALMGEVVGHARQRESAGRIVVGDLPVLEARLERAQQAMRQFEQGEVYQRAQAFDGRSAEAALARYPELDGAYKQLAGREGADRTALQAKLSEQLHRGELPQGAVTRDESRQVVAMAAAHRGLIVRDGDSFDRGIKGEVVAGSSHHVLVRVSDQVGLVYGRDRLDREVQVGERVSIEPGQQQHRVMAQEHVTAREPGRDQGRER